MLGREIKLSDRFKVVESLLDKIEKDSIEINLSSGKMCKIVNCISCRALDKYGTAIKRKKPAKNAFCSLICELALDKNDIKEELNYCYYKTKK